jgi:hypothetical protein
VIDFEKLSRVDLNCPKTFVQYAGKSYALVKAANSQRFLDFARNDRKGLALFVMSSAAETSLTHPEDLTHALVFY